MIWKKDNMGRCFCTGWKSTVVVGLIDLGNLSFVLGSVFLVHSIYLSDFNIV